MINGLLCEKWRLVQEIGEKTNKYTLWIRYKVRIISAYNKINKSAILKGSNLYRNHHIYQKSRSLFL